MRKEPWKEWIPGVLNKAQTIQLCEDGYLKNVDKKSIGASSIDLHLTDEGYVLKEGSIKPHGARYHTFIKDKYMSKLEPDDDIFKLEARKTYLIKLREQLHLSKSSKIYGQATAKSSIGRVDVLARLIVDGMYGYEGFIPEHLSSPDMYLEITPITFNINVKKDISLSQLRLFYCDPDLSKVKGKDYWLCLLRNIQESDGCLSVNLEETEIIPGKNACAFCAKYPTDLTIDLWKTDEDPKPKPDEFWEMKLADHGRLKIETDNFYILRSKEKIAVPKGIAVYCRAIDETIGEMRIHYAGFVHPHFGKNRSDQEEGTPLIFEVRGHTVDVNLIDGEKLARLSLFRMSEDAEPDPSPYDSQGLKLSKFFEDWK